MAYEVKGQSLLAVWVWVTDLVQVVLGGHVTDARRVPMLGREAIEVNGEIGKDAVSRRACRRGRDAPARIRTC
jgi:hypothetical protein